MKLITLLVIPLSLLAATFIFPVTNAAASTKCTQPADNYGTSTISVDVAKEAEYLVWVRMRTLNSDNKLFLMNINETDCGIIVGSNLTEPTSEWQWLKALDAPVNFSSGQNYIELFGLEPNVQVDEILITQQDCTPEGDGKNCDIAAANPTQLQIDKSGPNYSLLALGSILIVTSIAGGYLAYIKINGQIGKKHAVQQSSNATIPKGQAPGNVLKPRKNNDA